MTFKFDGNGLKFGRTWVDRIMGKVDKDQGVANAGKVLGIGADGQVVPVEQSGGGSEVLFEKITLPSPSANLYYDHNNYTSTKLNDTPAVMVAHFSPYRPAVTIVSVDEANATVHVTLANGNGGTQMQVSMFDGYLGSYSSTQHIASVNVHKSMMLNIETSITLNEDKAYFYIVDVCDVSIGKSSGSPFASYVITEFTNMYIKRSSDRKYFKVVVDNLTSEGKWLTSSVDIEYILVPPNILSTEPFPDA